MGLVLWTALSLVAGRAALKKRGPMTAAGTPTRMSDLLEALQMTLAASDPESRDAVGSAIEAYAAHFPEGFRWASGPQAPTLLHYLLSTIQNACQPSFGSRASRARCLIDRDTYPRLFQTSEASTHAQDAQSATSSISSATQPASWVGQDTCVQDIKGTRITPPSGSGGRT